MSGAVRNCQRPRMQDPPYDAGSFAKIVTRDASEEGGSAPACSSNVRQVRGFVASRTFHWSNTCTTACAFSCQSCMLYGISISTIVSTHAILQTHLAGGAVSFC